MKLTALVPMKGHSERIPRKNLRPLCGKPLCFWILETLSKVSEIGKVVVNTDSDEIAEAVCARFDVTIHIRPEEIRGDFVSMNRIIENDLSRLPGEEHFLQTHSTNPLLSSETVRKAARFYLENLGKHDSVFSVTRHQARFYDRQGKPVNHNPAELIRTQDLPPLLEENSNFYFFSKKSFTKTEKRIGEKPYLFEMDPLEAIDIDEASQWRLAEALLKTSS